MEQLKLNMIPNGVNPVFHASQYDKGRQIRFVIDETLSGAEVTVSYRAKDGTEYGNVQTSVSGNTITDTIPEEVLTDYGIIEGEVSIDGIGSLNFFVEVEKDAYDGGVITTQTASGAIATFETNIETAFASLTAEINPVQSGTGTPSPQNVRPISGFSALNVTRTGKNLVDNENYFPISDSISNSYYFNFAKVLGNIPEIKLVADTTYTFSFTINSSVTPFNISVGCGNGTYSTDILTKNNLTNGRVYITFTPTAAQLANGNLFAFRAPRFTTVTSATLTISEVQLELGSTATDYEPYNGQTKTVNFGQTVYGGVLDVTNGKLTITHIKISDFAQYYRDFFSGTYSTEYRITLPYPSTNVIYSVKRGSLCNCKNEESAYWGGNHVGEANSANDIFAINPLGEILAIYDSDTTLTKETFEAKYSGNIEFVYELATPIEVDITPENLTALSGQNNVYSDTNGDTEVEYYIEV